MFSVFKKTAFELKREILPIITGILFITTGIPQEYIHSQDFRAE